VFGVILFIHVLVCVLLIIVVLMQQTRGGGMSSVFGGGGGSADALFGGKGATPFFVKLTTGLVVGFFLTSLTLVLVSRRPAAQSAIDKALQEMPTQQGVPGEETPVIPEEPGTVPVTPGEGEQ
jgi:preprotein translocase subunit SecG